MNSAIVAALTRHFLTTIGGAFASRYAIDGASIEAIAGGIATLVGVAWSIFDKRSPAGSAA